MYQFPDPLGESKSAAARFSEEAAPILNDPALVCFGQDFRGPIAGLMAQNDYRVHIQGMNIHGAHPRAIQITLPDLTVTIVTQCFHFPDQTRGNIFVFECPFSGYKNVVFEGSAEKNTIDRVVAVRLPDDKDMALAAAEILAPWQTKSAALRAACRKKNKSRDPKALNKALQHALAPIAKPFGMELRSSMRDCVNPAMAAHSRAAIVIDYMNG